MYCISTRIGSNNFNSKKPVGAPPSRTHETKRAFEDKQTASDVPRFTSETFHFHDTALAMENANPNVVHQLSGKMRAAPPVAASDVVARALKLASDASPMGMSPRTSANANANGIDTPTMLREVEELLRSPTEIASSALEAHDAGRSPNGGASVGAKGSGA